MRRQNQFFHQSDARIGCWHLNPKMSWSKRLKEGREDTGREGKRHGTGERDPS
jgi:hypothetical protein